MNIPFRVKKLTETAKLPERANDGDLWDLFVDNFCTDQYMKYQEVKSSEIDKCDLDNPVVFAEELAIIKREKKEFFSMNFCNFLHGLYQAVCFHDSLLIKHEMDNERITIYPQGRILVKTGIAIELPILTDQYMINENSSSSDLEYRWRFSKFKPHFTPAQYAVADIRPRSGLALKHGITVLNTPGTIDNSYRKEIGVILYNAGHEPYTIKKGDKIAQMLIRPLYPSSFEVVEDFEDSGRGGFGSTGK